MLFVTFFRVNMTLTIENKVKAAELLVTENLVEERDPVPGKLHELLAIGGRERGESRGRPGHASLVDEKDVFVELDRPVTGHRLIKPATLTVHGPRVPVVGQLGA